MGSGRGSRDGARPPWDRAALETAATAYVGRYATTRAKLLHYLARKLRERGWADPERPPDITAIADRFVTLGYIDDRAFAESKGAALSRRGYGALRVGLALRAAGIAPEDAVEARATAEAEGWNAAVAFARRRRIGPFAREAADDQARRRAFAAMLRAGHPPKYARRLADAPPGTTPETPEDAISSYEG